MAGHTWGSYLQRCFIPSSSTFAVRPTVTSIGHGRSAPAVEKVCMASMLMTVPFRWKWRTRPSRSLLRCELFCITEHVEYVKQIFVGGGSRSFIISLLVHCRLTNTQAGESWIAYRRFLHLHEIFICKFNYVTPKCNVLLIKRVVSWAKQFLKSAR